MQGSGLWARVFFALLVATLPPIVVVVGFALLSDSLLSSAEPGVVALAIIGGVLVWAGVLTVLYGRVLSNESRALVAIARRGVGLESLDPGSPSQQVARALDERNRQIAALAQQASGIGISDEPVRVVESVVASVRSVMADSTWRCGVLTSHRPTLLPAGVYGSDDGDVPASPVGDLERWASVTDQDQAVRHLDGPWGAFVVIQLVGMSRATGILYAPWEGRETPSPADEALLRLVGQLAGSALEHALLYAEVRSQADELDRMARVQTDFLRGVTHDLQTPLTSIGALSTELRADQRVPDSARADLDVITFQADRLRRMVGQLLAASRLEADVLKPQIDVFDPIPVVERTWSAMRSARPFTLDRQGERHLAVGDADRFEQIVWAVLDNAVKYSPDGSPVEVLVRPDGSELTVSIVDHGSGMTAEGQAHAFEQFYRSPEARRSAPNGSGIGLFAARGLMHAMRGGITISSAIGQGTEVRLKLPAEHVQADD